MPIPHHVTVCSIDIINLVPIRACRLRSCASIQTQRTPTAPLAANLPITHFHSLEHPRKLFHASFSSTDVGTTVNRLLHSRTWIEPKTQWLYTTYTPELLPIDHQNSIDLRTYYRYVKLSILICCLFPAPVRIPVDTTFDNPCYRNAPEYYSVIGLVEIICINHWFVVHGVNHMTVSTMCVCGSAFHVQLGRRSEEVRLCVEHGW